MEIIIACFYIEKLLTQWWKNFRSSLFLVINIIDINYYNFIFVKGNNESLIRRIGIII